jgi:hypothetical protein
MQSIPIPQEFTIPKLYHQFKNEKTYINVDKMNRIPFEWFALTHRYGSIDTYGPIMVTYNVKRPLILLNIGNGQVRENITHYIQQQFQDEYDRNNIDRLSDPDIQYSGIIFNSAYHRIVKKYFSGICDGTIIDTTSLTGNSKYTKTDLDGPTEIVLWKDFTDILDEINVENLEQEQKKETGGFTQKKTRQKNKKKTKNTKKQRNSKNR